MSGLTVDGVSNRSPAVRVERRADGLRFVDFMRARVGESWAVAKQRRGPVMEQYDAVLLPREYEALWREFLGEPAA